ncbi:MAG: glucose-1-phosphate adenylyltransferase subunit GlgD [Clostridia bacterium]|nr:glucose-1-phosphate adenylyltransferase subunit GlgD [Clostridia bacterium]
MNAAGIIFSNLHDNNITELTRQRTMASIPFACRYRLIDFALSNMVNSGITNINVIAHYNYHSLMDHIGTGKDWDLARRTGGIKILPPYITAYANVTNSLYNTRLEALKSVIHSIRHIREDLVVLSDCDVICNIDIDKLLKYHTDANADITMVVKSVDLDTNMSDCRVILESDENCQITDVYKETPNMKGKKDACLYIWVINKDLLISTVNDAIAHDYTSFSHDIIAKNIGKLNMQVYHYTDYSATISSFNDYFATSMQLLENGDTRESLFGISDRPVFTKVRNSPPTKYANGSCVSNSLIADGCIIEGEVDNCILFRGVKIGRGAVVKNSILFQDTVVSNNVYLNCVVTDKNAVIRDGRVLSGHETMPIYVEKGRMI